MISTPGSFVFLSRNPRSSWTSYAEAALMDQHARKDHCIFEVRGEFWGYGGRAVRRGSKASPLVKIHLYESYFGRYFQTCAFISPV